MMPVGTSLLGLYKDVQLTQNHPGCRFGSRSLPRQEKQSLSHLTLACIAAVLTVWNLAGLAAGVCLDRRSKGYHISHSHALLLCSRCEILQVWQQEFAWTGEAKVITSHTRMH